MKLWQKLIRAAGTRQTGGDPEWDQVVLSMHGDTAPDGDEYWDTNTSILMHFDGEDNGTTLTDLKGKSFINNGVVTKTGEKKFGTASGYFGGSNSISFAANNDFDLSQGALTIECWFNQSTAHNARLITFGANGSSNSLQISPRSDGAVWAISMEGTGRGVYGPAGAFTINTWNHVAVVFTSNTTLSLYVNGVHQGTTTTTAWTSTSYGILLGFNTINYYTGYLDDFRFTKGVARYTTNFTPPTRAFPDSRPLLPDVKGKTVTAYGNTALSTSTKKFGAGSIYFDGTGDYLTLTGGTDFTFATGDFTVEGWVNPSSVAGTPYLIDFRSAAGTVAGSLYLSGGALRYAHTGTDRITGTTVLSTGQWYHFAVCRANGTTRLFLSGVQEGSNYTDSTNYTIGTSRPIIGANQAGSNGFNGHLDDIRITKGVARYTGTFDVPTKAFGDYGQPVDPYWSSVVLGMHMDGLDNGTVFHDEKGKTVNSGGNAKTVTATKKFGNSSAYFDGSGDYLTLADSADWDFGAGDFTIEFWVYPQNTSGVISLIHKGWAATYSPFMIYMGGGATQNTLSFFASSNGSSWDICNAFGAGIPLSNGVWSHVAVVRSGTTFKVYVNGDSGGASATSSASLVANAQALRIGNATNGTDNFLGYLDDLRITKGIARYTSNFSVPTRAFPRD